MKKLLLTGFGPFLEHTNNPSEIIANKLNGLSIGQYNIISHILEVSFDEVYQAIPKLLEAEKPDLVINLGLASDRNAITPELFAINYFNSIHPDNKGKITQHTKIISDIDALAAYYSPIDWTKALQELRNLNIPCELSTSAGNYVCNQTSYLFNYEISKKNYSTKQSFIHIPNNLSINQLIDAIRIIIQNIN